MKNYKIEITGDVNENYSEIINEYWEQGEKEFKNKPKQICAKHNITLGELNRMVKDFSKCEITHGYCTDCGQAMINTVYSQTSFLESRRKTLERCSDCSHIFFKNIQEERDRQFEEQKLDMDKKFELAVQERRWNDLSDEELDILKKIVHHKEKKLIGQEVFYGDWYDKSIWYKVKRIERLGLIHIERSEYGGAIKRFHFPQILEQEFKNYNFVDTELDFIGFSLIKNFNKSKVRQPDYSGTFVLKRAVKLDSDVKYIYGGWLITDGSINLKIQPVSNLEQKVENRDTSGEPTHVKQIIEKLFNSLTPGELPNDE
jgi:hypothetical protein